MSGLDGFDLYCEEKGIKPGEEPAAFAAYLNQRTGWEGQGMPICSCENDPDVCSVHGTRTERAQAAARVERGGSYIGPTYYGDPRGLPMAPDQVHSPPPRALIFGMLFGIPAWLILAGIVWWFQR